MQTFAVRRYAHLLGEACGVPSFSLAFDFVNKCTASKLLIIFTLYYHGYAHGALRTCWAPGDAYIHYTTMDTRMAHCAALPTARGAG